MSRTITTKNILEAAKGITGTGDLFREFFDRLDKNSVFVLDPGDFAMKQDGVGISISAPLASDVWYLHNHNNLITEVDTENYVKEGLKFLDEKLGGMKPLRGIQDPSQLLVESQTGWYSEVQKFYSNVAGYWINDLAYEFGYIGQGVAMDSARPRGGFNDKLIAYLTFPIGQLGIMEVISIFFETDTEADDFDLPYEEIPQTFDTGDAPLFPPDPLNGANQCFGEHLIEDGYKIPEDAKKYVELNATKVPPEKYGGIDVKTKSWMRFWLDSEKKHPVPGEFIGILVRPWHLPPHAWWFQESCPFVYAGNWWETEWLTSGVVTERTLEEDREDDGIGDEYKIRIHGIEITIYTTDFYRYEVDERVAVVKSSDLQRNLPEKPFDWITMNNRWDKKKDQTYRDYMIIPIAFYWEE